MKKILLMASFVAGFVSISQAQEKISSYYSNYFKKTYDVEASQSAKDTSNFSYYINGATLDATHEQVCISFLSTKLDDFNSFLTSAKNVYSKWDATAKANNVTELDKDIDVKGFSCTGAFVYGKWNFDFGILLNAKVRIVDNKMLLIVKSGEMQSSSNRFMTHKGIAFVFTSAKEVEDFQAAIDKKLLQAYFDKKNRKDKLFN